MCPIDKQQWAITEQQLRSLVTVAKDLRNKYQDDLDSKKKMGLALQERSDFLWYELLVSYSTWGGSRGSEGLIEDEKRYQQVSYEELKKIDAKEDRINRLRQIMKDAKVRWFNKKSAAEMMKFLKSFPGIGSKYASNIMMDCYHPLFRDRIALDSRVRSVSNELGLDFKNYSNHENFYLRVAKEAGIEGWELDRLIYGHTDDFLRFLRMVD